MRPSHFNLLNLELCEECSRTSIGPGATSRCMQVRTQSGAAAVEADAIGEQHAALHRELSGAGLLTV